MRLRIPLLPFVLRLARLPLGRLRPRASLRWIGLTALFLAIALTPLLLTLDRPVERLGQAARDGVGGVLDIATPDRPRLPGAAPSLPQSLPASQVQGPVSGATRVGQGPQQNLRPGPVRPLATSGPPPRPASAADAARASWSWDRAKDLASAVWEAQIPGPGAYSDFYCGCAVERRGETGGAIDLGSCGYAARANQPRAERLEWEHVVPAARIGQGRACWAQGAPQCVKDGTPFKGRECCDLVDPDYVMAATDPVNLVPAVGEVNADRSDMPYGLLGAAAGERVWSYGQCPMRISPDRDLAEPAPWRRGDVARIMAYMSQTYRLPFTRAESALYGRWMLEDPVSEEEVRINRAIEATGHRPNHLVLGR